VDADGRAEHGPNVRAVHPKKMSRSNVTVSRPVSRSGEFFTDAIEETTTMRLVDTDVVWTPDHDYNVGAVNRGAVRLEQHGSNWTRTQGDRWMPAYDTQDRTRETDRLLGLFILFNTLVVRDRIDPQAAHAAFLGIDEYRLAISPDAPGAD
jgi:hypothetical protein